MKKVFLIIVLISLLSFAVANVVKVNSVTPTSIDVSLEIDTTEFSQRIYPDGNSYSSVIKPVGIGKTVGNPNVPSFASWILIPNGTDVNISVNQGQPTIFENISLAPVQPALPELKDIKPPKFEKDKNIYSSDKQYPGIFAEVEKTKQKRGQDCTLLWIYPYQYNPVTKTLYYYPELNVLVNFSGTAKSIPTNLISENHLNSLKSMAINGAEVVDYELGISDNTRNYRDENAELLIITHQNFIDAAETLAIWKEKKGIETEIITTDIIGNTTYQIESYINDAYDNWETAPSYLLLLGDSEFLPTHYINEHPYTGGGQGHTGTDIFYSDTSYLPDYIADMGFGRIPVDTAAEADSVIARIIRYERNPPSESSYYTNAVTAGAFQDGTAPDSPPNTIADRRFCKTSEDARNFLNNTGYNAERIYTTYNGYGGGQINPTYWSDIDWAVFENDIPGQEIPSELQRPTYPWSGSGTDVQNSINAGKFLLLHRDHGWRHGWGEPDFGDSEVDNLNNGEKRPVVWSINCNTGWYDNETDDPTCGTDTGSECFTEHWMNHYSGGSIGLIASTRVSYSGYNDRLVWGWMDAIWPEFTTGYNDPYGNDNSIFKMSDVVNYGKEYMMTKVDDNDIRRTAIEEFHWFGDPTMEMWTAVPTDFSANYPETINIGSTQIQIDCDTENALVCLYSDGEILGKAYTMLGTAIVEFPVLTDVGTISLTISKHDYRILEDEITIISENTFIICDDASFTEIGMYTDGSIQSLDTLNVNVELTNIGFEDTENLVTAVLSTTSDYINIIQDSVESDMIQVSETVVLSEAFQIELLPGLSDNSVLILDLLISSGLDSWQTVIELPVNAPVIEFIGYNLEFDTGNDDILESGETASVFLHYINVGSGISYDFNTTLYTYSNGLTIEGSDLISQILPGEAVNTEQEISISVAEDFVQEDSAEILYMGLDSTGSLLTGSFDVHIGYIMLDFESNTDWIHYPMVDDSVDQWHLSNSRNFTEEGLFSMKCGDNENGSYATSMYTALETPAFRISDNTFVQIAHWMETPTYNGTLCSDGGIVEISVDGSDFLQITPTSGYPCMMMNNPNAELPFQTPMFAGDIEWEQIEFDLSEITGEITLRFIFVSAAFATTEGWYIDDMKIGFYPDTDTQETQINPVITNLKGNYPNPFNPTTKINFSIAPMDLSSAELVIFNIKGQEIEKFSVNSHAEFSDGSIIWDGKDKHNKPVSSGIYFYKLQSENYTAVKKMLMIK